MITITHINGFVIRELSGIVAELKRKADKNEIGQHVWLTVLQWYLYPTEHENQLRFMSNCTKSELTRLGVL